MAERKLRLWLGVGLGAVMLVGCGVNPTPQVERPTEATVEAGLDEMLAAIQAQGTADVAGPTPTATPTPVPNATATARRLTPTPTPTPELALASPSPLEMLAAHLERGDSYLGREQWDEAIAAYTKAIEVELEGYDLDNADERAAYACRGVALAKTRQYQRAIADLDKVSVVDGIGYKTRRDYCFAPIYWISRGIAYAGMGDWHKAYPEFKDAEFVIGWASYMDSAAWVARGYAYAHWDDRVPVFHLRDAYDSFQVAVALDRQNEEAQVGLDWVKGLCLTWEIICP